MARLADSISDHRRHQELERRRNARYFNGLSLHKGRLPGAGRAFARIPAYFSV
jgi:hypothetical protein